MAYNSPWSPANSINGKCHVHTLKAYQALHIVGDLDYFSRFLYKAATGEFKPDRVPVYCMCEMPYNPDLFMVECEGCDEWFHPECLQLTKREVEKMKHMMCPDVGVLGCCACARPPPAASSVCMRLGVTSFSLPSPMSRDFRLLYHPPNEGTNPKRTYLRVSG